jgi:signal recognition particle subunit SRP54
VLTIHFLKGQQADHKGKMLKRYMHMMDSMTDKELDGHLGNLERHPSRIWRVAVGSGSRPHEVVMLLRFHQQFEDMVNKMGKTGVLKNEAVMDQQMTRNPNQVKQQLYTHYTLYLTHYPNQVKQQLSRAMDPRVLQQMGGVDTMMTMMKHMQKNGGTLEGAESPKKKK